MILRNPTDRDIEIQYLGLPYAVEAEGTVEVSEEVAAHWLKIHAFLEVEAEAVAKKPARKTAAKKEEEAEEEDK